MFDWSRIMWWAKIGSEPTDSSGRQMWSQVDDSGPYATSLSTNLLLILGPGLSTCSDSSTWMTWGICIDGSGTTDLESALEVAYSRAITSKIARLCLFLGLPSLLFPLPFPFPKEALDFLPMIAKGLMGGAISKSSPVVIRFGWLAEEVGKAGRAMNRGGSSTRTSGAQETVGPSRKVLSWEEYPSSRWADQGCPISSIKILEESTFLISPNLTWLFDTSNQKRSAILETYQDKLKLGINYQNENYLRRSIKKKEKRTT